MYIILLDILIKTERIFLRMLNKIKWLLKKILIFFIYPLKTIKNKMDFDFLNTTYMNAQFIKKNKKSFSKLDLDNIKSIDLQEQTQLSLHSSEHMNNVKNSTYFTNLSSYGYSLKILEDVSFSDLDYVKSLHLYPANIFALNEIKMLIEEKLISNGLIVDYPSGIGNLLTYIEKFYDKQRLVGIDNFAQISKEDIKKYQLKIGSDIPIVNHDDFIKIMENKEIDLVVSIALNLDLIIENILDMNSKFLILETSYVSRYPEVIDKLEKNYSLYSVNVSIVMYIRKK